MKRRTFLWSFALAAGAAGAAGQWWQPDWFPARGLFNPCLEPGLPQPLADHPVISEALRGLDATKLWDCHVHLVGTGDGVDPQVWVNPSLDSLWHPYKALQALLTADDLHDRLLNGSDYPLSGILPLFSLNQLVRLGIIREEAASVVFEVQKYNPLLFDLALKRNLEWQGKRFSNRVFETAPFFSYSRTDSQG